MVAPCIEPGGTYDDVIQRIYRILSQSIPDAIIPSDPICHLVALIFGRPYCTVIKDVIVPRLDYWHYRSGDNIDFFCIGFFGGKFVPVQQDFSDQDFTNAVETFEIRSKWRYSGETDLVLMNAIFFPEYHEVKLDFSSVLSITLERAIEDKAFPSVPAFFEKLIHWSENYEGANPTWDFSDSRGFHLAGDTLKKFFLSLLPDKVGENVSKALHFYIKDLSMKDHRRR